MHNVPRNRFSLIVLGLFGVLLVGVASGCTRSPHEAAEPAQMVDSGSWYSRNQWPHDGDPYESEHFVVYSDGASLDARQQLAELADEVLSETVAEMGIDPDTMFRFPPGQDKIDLYANRYNEPDWGGGARGYYAGLIIWSFDHEAQNRRTDVGYFRPVLKHELVHVVESLLKGWDPNARSWPWVDVWFSEGMAEALTGGTAGGTVRTLDHIDELTAEYGRRSPIAYKSDSQVVAGSMSGFYYDYPMSGLAVEYLIDADGLGRSPEDLTRVLLDVAEDVSFATAFENHMGISVADYENQFFALMDDYLPQSSSPNLAMPIGIALFLIVAVGFMAGGQSWSARGWGTTASETMLAWRSGPRIGFVAEMTGAAVLVLGFFLLVLIQTGRAAGLSPVEKAAGFAAVGVYLIACVAILMWAVRRWASHARVAYVIPLLIIAATGVAIVTIELIF